MQLCEKGHEEGWKFPKHQTELIITFPNCLLLKTLSRAEDGKAEPGGCEWSPTFKLPRSGIILTVLIQ